MLNRLRTPLLIFSIGLNVAFVAMWLVQTVPDISKRKSTDNTVDSGEIPSVLHREIGVTPEQWKHIEPHVNFFREKAQEQRRTIEALRNQLMELLENPHTDESTIRAKQEEILSGQRGMQNLVIELLLKEREFLTQEQQKALIMIIHQYCTAMRDGTNGSRGIGRVLLDESP